jgi:hypothetical protein
MTESQEDVRWGVLLAALMVGILLGSLLVGRLTGNEALCLSHHIVLPRAHAPPGHDR